MRDNNILDALRTLSPDQLDYQDWCSVGMALKQEGYPPEIWEDWSRADSRYHPGECRKKWESFRGTATPVTGATIVKLAMDYGGYRPKSSDDSPGHALDWDSEIGGNDDVPQLIDTNWLEGQELLQPEQWDPVKDLTTYLTTLFESTENVGYVTSCWEKDGKFMPQKGNWDRTAGQLVEELSICDGDIGAVFGDCNPDVGAWIRFNPLDGNGVRNDNVTDYRYALVESDSMAIEDQNAAIRKLELPVACLVHSGGKSLHAIVRIEAANYDEYRKRVDYLYEVCKRNGLDIDRQNRNPSRLSRMPGVMRKGKRQWLVATNIGKSSWAEWKDWMDSINDDLPDLEDLSALLRNPPAKAPPLINGILLQGHKMLLAGPSKAGKSFSLIQLCIGIAEGTHWMGFPCAQGKVLYVNLELDRASCIHRFADVYAALGLEPRHADNIQIWNLRGKSVPMDQLAPKLIRRALKGGFLAVVIDPIYKVITGDENSADQMARFCNQFDKVCAELGCAVIYCHHHSKGAQGGKRSMDRASGSGVFARDPDALLDMIQLPVTEALLKQRQDKAVADLCQQTLAAAGLPDIASQDDRESRSVMMELCKENLTTRDYNALQERCTAAEGQVSACTAWRIEGTLREFPAFPPVNVWFDYPIHRSDPSGALSDLNPEAETPAWQRNLAKSGKRNKSPKERQAERLEALDTAFDACNVDGKVTVGDLAEYMDLSDKTVKRYIGEAKKYWVSDGEVGLKNPTS